MLALAACGDSPAPAQTSPLGAAAAATAAPTFDSLRDVDFEAPAFVAALVDRAGGGEAHAERVSYHDLTADGREEAVVVVESGGTAGDIAVAVYTLVEGAPELLWFQRLGGRVEVRLGLVVTLEGVYDAGDARCCPARVRERAYGWRDGGFALVSEQVVESAQD